jgi:hypothetical protein
MTKRKHFRDAASKNNFTPTESVYNEEFADESVDLAKTKKRNKRVPRG